MTNEDLKKAWDLVAVQWHRFHLRLGDTDEDARIAAAAAELRVLDEEVRERVEQICQSHHLLGWSGGVNVHIKQSAPDPDPDPEEDTFP